MSRISYLISAAAVFALGIPSVATAQGSSGYWSSGGGNGSEGEGSNPGDAGSTGLASSGGGSIGEGDGPGLADGPGYGSVSTSTSTGGSPNYTPENPDGCCFAPGSPFAPDSPTQVPEPATLVLLGTGLAGLAVARRRRRKR